MRHRVPRKTGVADRNDGIAGRNRGNVTSYLADDPSIFDSQRTATGFITRIDAKRRHQVHRVEPDRFDLDLDFIGPQFRPSGSLPLQMVWT